MQVTRAKQSRRLLLYFPLSLVFYEMGSYLANDMYLPALPQMLNDFHTTQSLMQTTLTAWFLGTCSIYWLLGPLADRYGRRKVLLLGGVIFIAGVLVCAFSHHVATMIAARFVQGAMVATLLVAGYATVHDMLDQKQAILTLAWMGSITVLAPAFGPLVGALLLEVTSWRGIFFFSAAWTTLGLIFLFYLMPESVNLDEKKPFCIRSILSDYRSILTNVEFMRLAVSFCAIFGAMIAWLTAGPFIVIKTFGLTSMDFGLTQLKIFGCYIIAMRFIPYLLKRMQVQRLVSLGFLFIACGSILGLLCAFYYSRVLYYYVLSFIVFSIGLAFIFSTMQRLAIDASQAPMGSRMSVFLFLMMLFGAIGTLAVSLYFDGSLFSFATIIFGLSLFGLLVKKIPARVISRK